MNDSLLWDDFAYDTIMMTAPEYMFVSCLFEEIFSPTWIIH